MVWLTPYNVIGTPYGNPRALKDTRGFFGAEDDSGPNEIVSRRDVDLVLVCRSSGEHLYYDKVGVSTMFTQLAIGAPPEWLAPVQLPDQLASAFRLYHVSP